MTNKVIFLSFASILAVFSILGGVLFWTQPSTTFGQADVTYTYKTITSSNASNTASYIIRGGAGSLGSITVGSSSATAIRVYDGTATSTGTLIATLKASVAEQTFNFDTAVTKGIAIDVPSTFNGVYTVTSR